MLGMATVFSIYSRELSGSDQPVGGIECGAFAFALESINIGVRSAHIDTIVERITSISIRFVCGKGGDICHLNDIRAKWVALCLCVVVSMMHWLMFWCFVR